MRELCSRIGIFRPESPPHPPGRSMPLNCRSSSAKNCGSLVMLLILALLPGLFSNHLAMAQTSGQPYWTSSPAQTVVVQNPRSYSVPTSGTAVRGIPVAGSERVIRSWNSSPSAPSKTSTQASTTQSFPATRARTRDRSTQKASASRLVQSSDSQEKQLGSRRFENDSGNDLLPIPTIHPRSSSNRLGADPFPSLPTASSNWNRPAAAKSNTTTSISSPSNVLPAASRLNLSWRQQMEDAYRAQEYFRAISDRGETPLADVASENENLVRQWIDLQTSLSRLSQQVVAAEDRLEETTLDFRDVTAKLQNYGLTPTIGLLLRNKSEQLDRWQAGDSQAVSGNIGLEDIRQQQLKLELISDDGSFPDQHAAEKIAAAGLLPSDPQTSSLQRRIADLYAQRYHWVVQLRGAYAEYHHSVGSLDSATRGFAELSKKYRRLIRKQITWIRSGNAIRFSDFGKLPDALGALFSSRRSESIGVSIGQKWESDRAGVFALMLWIALLGFVRWRAKSWLLTIGRGKTMKHREKEFQAAIAGLLTVATAICLPAMLYLISRWLGDGIVSTRACTPHRQPPLLRWWHWRLNCRGNH